MTPTFDYEHVVTFDETNLVGNVYFVNHLRWQGHCRELFLRDHAPRVLEELEADLALVTTRCSCEYYAELRAFDRIVVQMSLVELAQGRVRMRFDYQRDGALVARGEQEVACLRRSGETYEAVAVPRDLQAALAPYAAAAT